MKRRSDDGMIFQSQRKGSFPSHDNDAKFETIPLPGDTDSFYPSFHETVVTSDPKGIHTTIACHGNEFPLEFISGRQQQQPPDDQRDNDRPHSSYEMADIQGVSYSEEESATSTTPTPGMMCNLCRKVLKVPENGDKRLASSYASFVIGKLLSLIGSIGLLAGLTLRFFFLEDENVMRVISYFVVIASVFVFGIGAFLVIWTTLYKSQKARAQFDYERTGKPLSGGRPASTLSSSSFQSQSSGFLTKNAVKGNNIHTLQVPNTSINC